MALMTYGDDNGGSTPHNSGITIKGMSEFLARFGQIYTMPDKESKLLDYLPDHDVEFIKRRDCHIPEIDCTVGALDQSSLYKMLHCYLRGRKAPLSEDQACAQNIDTALFESFNHGRVFYDDMRAKMREVAKRAKIEHLCERLDETFDFRVERWNQQYR